MKKDDFENDILNTFLEVVLDDEESFLKIRETLTRIGIKSKKGNTLFQSCHILHKRSKYYIVSFKELYVLDGLENHLTEDDISRRNLIASLLEKWGLLKIVDPTKLEPMGSICDVKIVKHDEIAQDGWTLSPKYTFSKGKKP